MNNFLKAIFLFSALNCCMGGYSQNTRKDSINLYFEQIDFLVSNQSLYKQDFLDYKTLRSQKETARGQEKVDVLLKLCQAKMFDSINVAHKFIDEALELALSLDYRPGILEAKYHKAYLPFIKGDFDRSMVLALEIENIYYYKDYPRSYADVNTLKSDIYTERGAYDKALEIGLKLLDKAEKANNDYLLMKANASLSHYYLRIGNYAKALDHCLKGLHYIIKFRKVKKFLPKIDEIARMSSRLNDIEGALEAYRFFEKIEGKMEHSGSYIRSSVYTNMAVVYISNGDYANAEKYISDALRLNYENNYKFRIPRALIVQAELYLKRKDSANAILSYEKSLKAAEDIDAFDVIKSNSLILSELYNKSNNLSKAYEYKTLYKVISDSLFSKEKEQRIVILETKRDIKEVTQEKMILGLENAAQKARLNTIILVLIFLSIVSGLSVYSYLKVKSKNKLLYHRTIELAEVHLKMNEKLAEFQNGKRVSTVPQQAKVSQDLDEDVKNIILRKLEKLERDNFFIDPNCSLRQLAQQLKTNPKYLSQVINQEKESNFNNYINGLRINYLLPKLLQDVEFRNSKLVYIAVSIGYNNLNTFNAAFKKRQGILPSYFIQQLNSETKSKVGTKV